MNYGKWERFTNDGNEFLVVAKNDYDALLIGIDGGKDGEVLIARGIEFEKGYWSSGAYFGWGYCALNLAMAKWNEEKTNDLMKIKQALNLVKDVKECVYQDGFLEQDEIEVLKTLNTLIIDSKIIRGYSDRLEDENQEKDQKKNKSYKTCTNCGEYVTHQNGYICTSCGYKYTDED